MIAKVVFYQFRHLFFHLFSDEIKKVLCFSFSLPFHWCLCYQNEFFFSLKNNIKKETKTKFYQNTIPPLFCCWRKTFRNSNKASGYFILSPVNLVYSTSDFLSQNAKSLSCCHNDNYNKDFAF